jgi:hypothetical protein
MVEGVGGEDGGGGKWECSEAPERLAVMAGEKEKEDEGDGGTAAESMAGCQED